MNLDALSLLLPACSCPHTRHCLKIGLSMISLLVGEARSLVTYWRSLEVKP